MALSTEQKQVRQSLALVLDTHQALALDGGNFSGRTDLLRWITHMETTEGAAGNGEQEVKAGLHAVREQRWRWRLRRGEAVRNGKLAVYIGPEVYNTLSGFGATVREELRLHAGCSPEESSVARLIPETGLHTLYDRNPFTLSGGEQALLAITKDLALEPGLLAIDCALEQIDSTFKTRLLGWMLSTMPPATRIVLADNYLSEIDGAANLHRVAIKCVPTDHIPNLQFDPLTSDLDLPLAPTKPCQLSLSHINFRYPRSAVILNNASAQLQPGTLYSLEGRNGAGKSTLAKLLCGVLRPNSGKIFANEEQVQLWKHPAQVVAYHFQNPDVQLFSTTIEQEVKAGLHAWRLNEAQCEQRVEAVLSAFGLTYIRKEHPLDLPFVMRKRVALAATIAMGKPWLILDEPTLGQDSASAEVIARIIEKLLDLGTGVIVISHSLRFRQRLSATPLKLEEGLLHQ